MWVLVIFEPKANEVEVLGPWDDADAANRAAKGYREGLVREGREKSVVMATTKVRPMVYFQGE